MGTTRLQVRRSMLLSGMKSSACLSRSLRGGIFAEHEGALGVVSRERNDDGVVRSIRIEA